jgi:type IV secretory pathway VirB10-like protein
MSKGAKKATYQEPPASNHVAFDPRDAQIRELQRRLDALERERLARQQSSPAQKGQAKPPERERAKAIYVVNAEKRPEVSLSTPLYTLAVWEYIPCVLENVLNSEIPGTFTVKITRPVLDATRQHVLLPQGQRVGAKADTADLLFGNERIPTFGLSVSLPNGQPLELGHAPIMDAAGTNGLTGEVNNHIWRLIWTSVFIGGLRGGQQVLQTQMGADGVAPIVAGIAREGSSATQQRLGRAQDTRPTIIAHSGELCNILIPAPMPLPSFAAVPRE